MKQTKNQDDTENPNQALYDNIQLLDELLYQSLETQLSPELNEIIAHIAKEARKAYKTNKKNNPETILSLIDSIWKILEPLNNQTLLSLTRAFSQFLNLTNIAEQYHRIRRRRWHQEAGHPAQPGSLEAVLPALLKAGISKEKLYQTVCELNIELVLTAHPTEATRRTLIHKHIEIAKNLEHLDRVQLSPDERDRVILRLHEEIMALSRTIEIRPQKPSAIEEAKWGFAVVQESLWEALPNYMRDLDNKLENLTGQGLPLDKVPLRMGSWMGGDRDGNPNVTSAVTRKVIFLARKVAAELFYKDIAILHESLSLQECSPELRVLVGDALEPYRKLLRGVREKLLRSQYWAECQIEEREVCPSPDLIYLNTRDFLEPLLICYRSLMSIGAKVLAQGQLLDVIRRVYAFGLTLLPLDIRQSAEKHLLLMDALTESVQLSPYSTWSENERQNFLLEMIREKAPPSPAKTLAQNIQKRNSLLSDELQDYLEIFHVITENTRESFGSYIISMAGKPSDVLLPFVLQRIMDPMHPNKAIKIVPLFETLEDLNFAPACIEALLNIPEYREHCQGSQEVMIGYSDSAKDAGFLAASWAQYSAQDALTALSKKMGIQIRFFHGRGGSVGRGGGPSYLAIRSQPPGSIQGALRVTQQGEVIRYRFGLQKIAERTLSIYTTATLEATLLPAKKPLDSWRHLMDKLSEISTKSYRALVKDNPEFLSYFAAVTPLNELDKMTIASRPSRRYTSTDISSLRAIPWIFAWVQNRLLVPAWYGVGDALKEELNTLSADTVESPRKQWPYFSSLLSLMEISLAKVDPLISEQYEFHLANKNLWPLGVDLRNAFEETQKIVSRLLQDSTIEKAITQDSILQRSIAVRSPYLLVLHLLQISLLKKSRKLAQESIQDETLEQALLVSITGIAAGMLNTG